VKVTSKKMIFKTYQKVSLAKKQNGKPQNRYVANQTIITTLQQRRKQTKY